MSQTDAQSSQSERAAETAAVQTTQVRAKCSTCNEEWTGSAAETIGANHARQHGHPVPVERHVTLSGEPGEDDDTLQSLTTLEQPDTEQVAAADVHKHATHSSCDDCDHDWADEPRAVQNAEAHAARYAHTTHVVVRLVYSPSESDEAEDQSDNEERLTLY